jgi:hypothetical protein
MEARAWLAARGAAVTWYWAEAIHEASMAGQLAPLVNALRTRRIVYIGPAHLRGMARWLPIADFVEVPLATAWENVGAIEAVARAAIRGGDCVLVSAGPAAKVLIDRLSDLGATMLDVGSVFDMYVGRPSRSGPKRLTAQQLADLTRRNFHGEAYA